MTRMAQDRFDGFAVDLNQGRFTGRFDMEADEVARCALDEVVVGLVVARVKSATPEVKDNGDIQVTRVLKVTDFRVITDAKVQEEIVTKMGLWGSDTVQLPLKSLEDEEPRGGHAVDLSAEVTEGWEEWVDSEGGETERPLPPAKPVAPDRPKVERGVDRFTGEVLDHDNPEEHAPDTGAPEVLGNIYGRKRDEALAAFLDA